MNGDEDKWILSLALVTSTVLFVDIFILIILPQRRPISSQLRLIVSTFLMFVLSSSRSEINEVDFQLS